MTDRIYYAVAATLPDRATADEYVAWLEDGHLDAILALGAHSAMIVRIDTPPGDKPRVETHYVFPTRELYDRYISRHAPTVRAEGLKRFPPERGVSFERRVGVIV